MSRGGRVVFVGNIPYGVPEEEIIHMLSRAGEVVNFRLITDKETGKPKGFGFAEFTDHDSAASAVRNLNDQELGGRRLRVDWSNDGDKDGDTQRGDSGQTANINGQVATQAIQSATLPPLPPGTDLPAGLECPDAISNTLKTLPPPQLLDIMSQMKNLAKTDPVRATALLAQSPQFSYAIFQALLLLGLVDTNVLSSVIEQTQQAAPTTAPPAPAAPQPPAQGFGGYPQFNQPAQVATPPMAHQPFQQPPVQQPAPQMSQEVMIQQLLQMPQHQIDALAPDQRAMIMQLRQQYGVAQRGY